MERNNPRITVIIPEKDRKSYLFHTLRTCTTQSYQNLEIIVADDLSTDGTIDMVKDFMKRDSRITLLERTHRLGMRDNFEDALSRVKEGYVIVLGGDDGIMPEGISRLAELLVTKRLPLVTWCPPVYEYSSDIKPCGQFSVNRKRKDYIVSSKDFLERQTRDFCYVGDVECPMFYVKGVASIELINKVKERSPEGRFYSCPTPDGYSGIVLAGEVEEFYFSAEAFTLYGVSPSSQGQVYKNNDSKSKEQSQEFFNFVAAKGMHEELAGQPYSPLLSLMTVDYLLTARDLPGWPGRFPKIDYKRMLSHSVKELCRESFGEERVQREIDILYAIADKHGLKDYLEKLLDSSRRTGVKSIFIGDAISRNMLYINPKNFDISNIYEASIVAFVLSKTISLPFLHLIKNVVKNTFRILQSNKVKGCSMSKYKKQ